MSWFDDMAGALGGGLSGAAGGFMMGGPVGAIAGGLGGGLMGYAGARSQSDANAKNEALTREQWGREDSAVQRRAKDMQAAGFNPLLAAGSPASASPASRMEPVDSGRGSSQVIEALRGYQDIAKSLVDQKLVQAQTRASEVATKGGELSNKLADSVLTYKRLIERTNASDAVDRWHAKANPTQEANVNHVVEKSYGWTNSDGNYLGALRDALISQLQAEGYNTRSAKAQATIDEILAEWKGIEDKFGGGYSNAVGNWTGAAQGVRHLVEPKTKGTVINKYYK